MAVFIDTGILVALHNRRDTLHARSKAIMARIRNKEYGAMFTSDYVLDEATQVVLSRTRDRRLSQDLLSLCLGSGEALAILNVDDEDFVQASRLFLESDELSFTDCSTVVLMHRQGIEYVATFDSDFRRVPGVQVLMT